MLLERRIKDIGRNHYTFDESFQIERNEYHIPLYFIDSGIRKGRITIEKYYAYSKGVILWSVKIYQEFQRKGYGTQLLNETLQYIIDKIPSAEKVGLYVYCDNEIAIRLYKKMGFKITKKIDYDNSYFMEKLLTNPRNGGIIIM